MKLQEVRVVLFREIAPLLPGWKLVKKEHAFVRPIEGGLQRVIVPVVDYRPEFRFSLTFGIRLDAVETIYHQFSGATAADAQKLSNTSLIQLDYFIPGPKPRQYSVASEADIIAAVTALAPILRDPILPWLDRHRTVAALDAALNGDDPAIDISDRTHRTMHALIVAHLARNPDFDQLVARYQEQMSGFLDQLKQKVASLVDSLKKEVS